MNPYLSRRSFIIAFMILCFLFYFVHVQLDSGTSSSIAVSVIPSTHRYAYCTFLAPNVQATGTTLYDEDHYFTSVRMLAYQLLHDPATKTNSSIPLVVLVTTDVLQSNRDRLTKDGAVIVEVSPITFDWIKPGRERWMRVMDKLHVFELVQFEKILLLDSDIVVVKPLDGLFEDAATAVLQNLGQADNTRVDEAPQPSSYLMAGIPDATAAKGLNSGFVVLQPSVDMFNHYLSVGATEGRFNGSWPEQDLWNYVHRNDGNMPWRQISGRWTVNSPWYQDYENGTASFHEKYWGCGRDQKMRGVLLKSRFEMEGYFQARDELSR